MTILYMIAIGFLVGLIARALKPGRDKMGLILTSLLGIGGSFVAAYVGQILGWYRLGQSPGFIASVLGAIAILVIADFIKRKL